jgi:radical SAM protein with 4Fe4S-binding SPASM domain
VRIVDQIPELNRAVLHGIGEPLLNEALPAMIRHLKKRKKPVEVLFNSNGILLDEPWQAKLIEAGLDELRISLDAASPEGYRLVRNSGKFERVVNNLRRFSNRLRLEKISKPRMSLWYLGTRENIAELPDFVRLAASIGIGEIHLQRLVYFQDHEGYGLAKPEKTLTLEDAYTGAAELIQQSQELARQFNIQFSASGLCGPVQSIQGPSNTKTPWKTCFRPWKLMYITANGNVLPCCISPFSTIDYASITLGNVFETALEAIWTGDKYQTFRAKHQTSSPPGCCRSCGALWSL